MGLDELSVSPASVLPLRKIIRGLDLTLEKDEGVDLPGADEVPEEA